MRTCPLRAVQAPQRGTPNSSRTTLHAAGRSQQAQTPRQRACQPGRQEQSTRRTRSADVLRSRTTDGPRARNSTVSRQHLFECIDFAKS